MTQTPTLNGQDIGQAHRATRALLERRLAATGTEFNGWVTLNVLGSQGPILAEDDLVSRVVQGLKVDDVVVRDVVTQLLDQGLIDRTSDGVPQISLTASGIDLSDHVKETIAQITERLYGGLPVEELAIAHRILAAVTARANAELNA